MSTLENKIIELETKLAFAEDSIEQLNIVAINQSWRRKPILARTYKHNRRKASALL